MISHHIAVNYAKALFNTEGNVQKREDDLQLLSKLIKEVPGMLAFLASPMVDFNNKMAIYEKAIGSPLDSNVKNLLQLLIRRRNVSAISQIASEYHKLVIYQLKEIDVQIHSAQKLTNEELNLIKKRLEQSLNQKLSISEHIDNNLLGGFTVFAHDKFLDLSLKGKLTKLKTQLTKGKV